MQDTPLAAASDASTTHWTPSRSLQECDRILTAPGKLHEIELAVVNGRVLRVYKNLPPNTRDLWLDRSAEWRNREYVVFENERYTYGDVRARASKLASLLYSTYAVRKGDRVAIVMRNFPEFVVIFWAIQLLGGVATMINAWSPIGPLLYCIETTRPKVVFVDPERADKLAGAQLDALKQTTPLNKVFVIRPHECPAPPSSSTTSSSTNWRWKGISALPAALADYHGPAEAWRNTPPAVPEDDATIFFTSGTTGLPKGVLSSHRAFLTIVRNGVVSRARAMLRRGEDLPAVDPSAPQSSVLLSVPLFHVTGLTSTLLVSTAQGAKLVLMRKWDKEEAACIIIKERVNTAGGVPSVIMDLLESSLVRGSGVLEALSCGGTASPETMPKDIARRWRNVSAGQGYGLSETNAITMSIHGDDFLLRPTSTGIATPVNDLLIVDPATQRVMPPGEVGELWIRGPNIMKGYIGDQESTDKAITLDGWFKSGDLATIDEEGFVYIKDRVKDIIIRGGENIHSVEVENALYADERVLDAAAVSVPDKRLGELVAAVVATKPHFRGRVREDEVIAIAKKSLPHHAVPVMILVQDDLIERNANGKIMKADLRKRVRKEWARRLKHRATHTELGSERRLSLSASASAVKAKL